MTAGPPASSASAGEARQRRPLLEDRRGDADALGDVVQREAEHEERAKPGRTGGERRADGEPLAEIVQADAERDVDASASPLGAPCAPADGHQEQEARGSREHDHRRPLEDARRPSPRAPAPPRACRRAGSQAGRWSAPAGSSCRCGRRRAAPDRTSARSRPAGCRRRRRGCACATRLLGVATGVGTATAISCSKVAPVLVTNVDAMRLAQHPRERNRDPRRRRRARSARPDPA